jgi:SHAQKYF class myb-like DNA-binding protein
MSQQSEVRPILSTVVSTQSVPSSPGKATTVNKLKSSQLPPLPTSTQKQTFKQQKHKSISKLQTSTKLSTPSKENHQPMKTAITTTNPLSTPSSTKNSTQSLPKTTTTPSSTSSSSSSGRWTKAEHEAFLDGLKIHGREWKKVAQNIPTRTSAQIRSHAQKYFAKLARDEQQHHHQQVAMLWCSNSSGGGGSIGVGTNNSIGGDGLGLASPLSKAIGHDDSNYCNEHQLCHHANLTQSVLERVEKILKDPEGAQLEVEQTLQRLRKRYNELQQKVREKQAAKRAAAALNATREGNHGSDDGNDEHLDLKYPMGVLRQKANYKLDDGHLSSSLPKHSATTTPIVTFSQESNKNNIHQTAKAIEALAETTHHNQKITSEATTTATHHRLRNDLLASKELIALHVLGGELYRSGSKENLTSATQNGHNCDNHISNDNNNNDKQYDNNDSSGEDKNDNKTKKSTMN